jgi:carbonic anhydrase
MSQLSELLDRNKAWAGRMREEDPSFFRTLARPQAPQYLWIGCADSRVPETQITDLHPGDMFVHRNVANIVVHADLNALSVMQFAVDLLKVRHIIVCGHYGCSGVHAAMAGTRIGLADNWLRHVGDIALKHAALLDQVESDELRHARLCELNVIEQAGNVCHSTVVQDAWARGQPLSVHAWIYGLNDGRIRQLGRGVEAAEQLAPAYAAAIQTVRDSASQPWAVRS